MISVDPIAVTSFGVDLFPKSAVVSFSGPIIVVLQGGPSSVQDRPFWRFVSTVYLLKFALVKGRACLCQLVSCLNFPLQNLIVWKRTDSLLLAL